MFYMKHEVEKQYEWSKKGKKYKTKYFGALKDLYGSVQNDKDSHKATDRTTGTNQVCGLVEKDGV